MAPGRRLSNGRSPLVNKQSQITTFFGKSNSATPSPPLTKQNPKIAASNPNPSQKPDSSPSRSPTTPSPLQSRPNKTKPVLVIPSGEVKAAAPKPYGQDVVGKRIKVFWPLDKVWYEGCVKSFDEKSKKHLILYDDAEEELLDLGNEKTEWIEERPRQLKRLRRGGAVTLEKAAVELAVAENVESQSSDGNAGGGADDSSDEDWESNNVEKEVEEDMEVDLVDEDEDDDGVGGDDDDTDDDIGKKSGGKIGGKSVSRKRKACGGGNKSGPEKKSKCSAGGLSKEGRKVSSPEMGKTISECK